MTGDALLSALRTFGPAGATIAQLRERLGVGSEDLDIGLKVLRDARLVIVENRRVMIPPDFTPRTRLDSPLVARYHEAHPDDHSINHPHRKTLTLGGLKDAEPAEAQTDAA